MINASTVRLKPSEVTLKYLRGDEPFVVIGREICQYSGAGGGGSEESKMVTLSLLSYLIWMSVKENHDKKKWNKCNKANETKHE